MRRSVKKKNENKVPMSEKEGKSLWVNLSWHYQIQILCEYGIFIYAYKK